MQVLPTVPSPTTTHLIGRPEDMIDPSLEPQVEKIGLNAQKTGSQFSRFWVLSGHLESFWYIFAYLCTLDPLLFVPEWPFFAIAYSALEGK